MLKIQPLIENEDLSIYGRGKTAYEFFINSFKQNKIAVLPTYTTTTTTTTTTSTTPTTLSKPITETDLFNNYISGFRTGYLAEDILVFEKGNSQPVLSGNSIKSADLMKYKPYTTLKSQLNESYKEAVSSYNSEILKRNTEKILAEDNNLPEPKYKKPLIKPIQETIFNPPSNKDTATSVMFTDEFLIASKKGIKSDNPIERIKDFRKNPIPKSALTAENYPDIRDFLTLPEFLPKPPEVKPEVKVKLEPKAKYKSKSLMEEFETPEPSVDEDLEKELFAPPRVKFEGLLPNATIEPSVIKPEKPISPKHFDSSKSKSVEKLTQDTNILKGTLIGIREQLENFKESEQIKTLFKEIEEIGEKLEDLNLEEIEKKNKDDLTQEDLTKIEEGNKFKHQLELKNVDLVQLFEPLGKKLTESENELKNLEKELHNKMIEENETYAEEYPALKKEYKEQLQKFKRYEKYYEDYVNKIKDYNDKVPVINEILTETGENLQKHKKIVKESKLDEYNARKKIRAEKEEIEKLSKSMQEWDEKIQELEKNDDAAKLDLQKAEEDLKELKKKEKMLPFIHKKEIAKGKQKDIENEILAIKERIAQAISEKEKILEEFTNLDNKMKNFQELDKNYETTGVDLQKAEENLKDWQQKEEAAVETARKMTYEDMYKLANKFNTYNDKLENIKKGNLSSISESKESTQKLLNGVLEKVKKIKSDPRAQAHFNIIKEVLENDLIEKTKQKLQQIDEKIIELTGKKINIHPDANIEKLANSAIDVDNPTSEQIENLITLLKNKINSIKTENTLKTIISLFNLDGKPTKTEILENINKLTTEIANLEQQVEKAQEKFKHSQSDAAKKEKEQLMVNLKEKNTERSKLNTQLPIADRVTFKKATETTKKGKK